MKRRQMFPLDPDDHRDCQWWCGCPRPAVVLVEHPVLPPVPTCAEHARWIEANS